MKAHFCIGDYVNRELVVSNKKYQSFTSLRQKTAVARLEALLQNYEKRLLASLCPSVRPLETTRLPLEEFLWYFLIEYFEKYVGAKSTLIKI
jgi:hypothetical protein